jgi:hypothetical protein
MENNRSINPSRNQEYQTADVDVVLTRKGKKKTKGEKEKIKSYTCTLSGNV